MSAYNHARDVDPKLALSQEKIDAIVDGMADLLESNPNGIMALLRQDQVNGRNVLTSLNTELINRGEDGQERMGELIGAMLEDAGQPLDPDSPEAQNTSANIGFFTGTVQGALDDATLDAQVGASRETVLQVIAGGITSKVPDLGTSPG